MKRLKKNYFHKINALPFTSVLLIIILFSVLASPLMVFCAYDLPEETVLHSKGAIIISLGTSKEYDTVLFEKNADAKYRPAALVHTMVGLTAVKIAEENGIDLSRETVTYSKEHLNEIAKTGITTANMKVGEKWLLSDLLHISLIRTAGDATVALATELSSRVGGGLSEFVDEMNRYLTEIGCTDTKFANVFGIDHISQYTTARDFAKIVRHANDVKTVREILATNIHKCGPQDSEIVRTFTGTNTLLGKFEPLLFGKSGMTGAEGFNFASYHQKSGYDYVCVVLGSSYKDSSTPNFDDTKTLVNWALNGFAYKTILHENEPVTQINVGLAWNKDFVTLIPSKPFASTINKDLDPATIEQRITLFREGKIDAPIIKGQVYGKVEFFIRIDEKIGEVDLIASESVEASQIMSIWRKSKSVFGSFWFRFAVIILIVLFVVYIIINIIHNYRRRKKHQKKLKKYR